MKIFGWGLLLVGSYVLGALLSSVLSGFTDFDNDHRGEWAPLVWPMLLLIAGLGGGTGARWLRRAPPTRWWIIGSVGLAGTVAAFAWITWRFSLAG